MSNKPAKTRSLKNYILRLWLLVTGILFILFTLFSVIFIGSMRKELLNSGQVFADHYAGNLSSDVQQMADTVDEMYVNNIFFQRLITYKLDDFDWVDNTWHIQSSLQEKSSALDFLGGLFFYDSEKDSMRSSYSQENTDNSLNDHLIEWIRTHYDTPLSVRNLSEKLGYHPTYLTSLLKKHTGYTIKGLLNYYRIDAAKNLLCTSPSASYSVKRIASICGFVDEKYFMRVFRTLEGMTPSQYRNAFNEKKLVTK